MDMWTSPPDQLVPYGTCAQTMDNSKSELPTVCTHSQASRPHTHKLNNKLYIFLKKRRPSRALRALDELNIKQKGTFLNWGIRGHFKIGLTPFY